MAFQQVYQAKFGKPLMNQLIAIIQRDQGDALNIINAERMAMGNLPLTPIEEFHKGPAMRTGWPWLFLAFGDTQFDQDTDLATRHGDVTIVLHLDTGQYDQEAAQDDAQDYGRMLDMTINGVNAYSTNNLSDWTEPLPIEHETVPQGFTVPNAVGSVKNVFVESHVPGTIKPEGADTPAMRISLNVRFELEEE